MKKLIIIPILIVHHFLFAQNFLVSGIVTDENGQGVPGVNVIEKALPMEPQQTLMGNILLRLVPRNLFLSFHLSV